MNRRHGAKPLPSRSNKHPKQDVPTFIIRDSDIILPKPRMSFTKIAMYLFFFLFVATAFVNLPKYKKKNPKPIVNERVSSSPEELKVEQPFLNNGRSCEELIKLAKDLMDSKPPREWDAALDNLALCALQDPQNVAARWNMAVILVQLDRTEEALEFIDQALTLDPNNLEYLKTSGMYLLKMGLYSEVVRCLERYMKVALGVPDWDRLLASISVQREDEWVFLYDAGDDVVKILESLQSAYLHEMSLIKANYLYKVIIGLRGEDVDKSVLAAYSFFAFGLGDFATGIKYLRLYTEKQYVMEEYGDAEQAYEVVTAHSLRLFTAGFDSHIVGIGKNLLMGGASVWEELVYNCGLMSDDSLNYSKSISLTDVRAIFIKCVLVQDTIKTLVDGGAVLYAENLFGWTPLLHAVALGDRHIINLLLKSKADPQSRTVLAHTALHVAAMRGTYNTVPTLVQSGLKPSEVDYFNRTALHIACMHGWSVKGMAEALGQQELPPDCPFKPVYHPPPKLSMYGGWLSSSLPLPKELTTERCDFDVLNISDIRTFIFDYLALQRPVLIRNATSIHSMKKLHNLWQRSKFEQEYGALIFNEVEIPYAESFGYSSSTKTTAKAFMSKMKLFQEENKHLPIGSVPHPNYIFETISPNSPLLKEFEPPSILDKEVTHINPLKTQFYLGSPLSGAPVHFHRNAWNVLIYGQKRWFLYPPDKAFYSKEHVWDWWRGTYRKSPDALECVQYPGDLVFVPDMWGHAVINLREGVGVASEFVYGASEFSI